MIHLLPVWYICCLTLVQGFEAQANPHQPKHGRAHPTCLVCAAKHTSHGGKGHSLLAPSRQGQVFDRRPCQATSAQLRARLGVCSAVQALLAVPQHPSQTHSRNRGRTFYRKRSCCSGATDAYSASAAASRAASACSEAAAAGSAGAAVTATAGSDGAATAAAGLSASAAAACGISLNMGAPPPAICIRNLSLQVRHLVSSGPMTARRRSAISLPAKMSARSCSTSSCLAK